jgi:hypothetical protein
MVHLPSELDAIYGIWYAPIMEQMIEEGSAMDKTTSSRGAARTTDPRMTEERTTMEKTTLYLTTELHEGLKALSLRSGRSQAALIREALHAYIAQQEWPLPSSTGIGSDPELSGEQVEDWLEENWRPV